MTQSVPQNEDLVNRELLQGINTIIQGSQKGLEKEKKRTHRILNILSHKNVPNNLQVKK